MYIMCLEFLTGQRNRMCLLFYQSMYLQHLECQSITQWIWLTFQDRCNEEFTNIDGIRRIPLSRQLSIRFSQQRKLTLSRNATNRWRSATQKVRVRKTIASFALSIIATSRLVLLLNGFLFTFLAWSLMFACIKHEDVCRIFVSVFTCYCRLMIVIDERVWKMRSQQFYWVQFQSNLPYCLRINLLLLCLFLNFRIAIFYVFMIM